jgi:8-oxo-dGTP pyrophosphatase MutT (NUDIX family)
MLIYETSSIRTTGIAMTKRTSQSASKAVAGAPRNFSAGIVPIFQTTDGVKLFLLLRCYNYWDFPKGGVHSQEPPLTAALRELKEETTLEEVDFSWGESFMETPVYAHNKVARYYVGKVKQLEVSLPVNPALGRPEHHEFRWLRYEDARPLLGDRVKSILDWAKDFTDR